MIPKIIHYVWLGGKLPEKAENFILSWKECCPDYEIIRWDETNFDIGSAPDYVKEAYNAKKYAFVADYIRLFALFEYGGIYLDTDVEMLKNFDDLLKNNLFFCRENSAYISTAVIGAEKGNEIIRTLMDGYKSRHFVVNGNFDLTTNVETISLFLRKKFNYPLADKTFDADGIVIYESRYFSPKDYFSGKMKSTKNSYAIHHFDASWDTKGKSLTKKLAKLAFKVLPKCVVFKIVNIHKKKMLKSRERELAVKN